MKRYAVMWSGGKDSALAAYRARERGLAVDTFLNFYDAASGRVRFHATPRELIAAQATAAGVMLRAVATTWEGFEPAFRNGLRELAGEGYAGIVFGDIHLADVRGWYEERVRAAGLEHVEPLWGEPPPSVLREFVAGGGRAVVTCCETGKLDEAWLGRIVDERFVREIEAVPIDPCGENGEYHSFAFSGPPFAHRVGWAAGPRRAEGRFRQLDLVAVADAPIAH